MRKLATLMTSCLILWASAADAGPAYRWVTTEVKWQVRPFTIDWTIEFESGGESSQYYVQCYPPQGCYGNVNGVSGLFSPSNADFSPVVSMDLRVTGTAMSFSKTGLRFFVFEGDGLFVKNWDDTNSTLRMKSANEIDFFNSDATNCAGYGGGGGLGCFQVLGYWASVPLPTTLVLLGLGLAGIGAARRKQA